MTATYDRNTVVLHWTTAALVAVLWVLGQTADWFPRGPARGAAWSTHFTLGAILLIVYLVRLFWRVRSGRRLPGVGPPPLVKAATWVHRTLYLGIGVVIAAEIANLFAHGSSVWGLFHYPRIADAALRHNINEVHEWAANLLLLLAVGHAAVALAHQYVWRDGVLGRMWPSLAR